jgi:magnesium transporter
MHLASALRNFQTELADLKQPTAAGPPTYPQREPADVPASRRSPPRWWPTCKSSLTPESRVRGSIVTALVIARKMSFQRYYVSFTTVSRLYSTQKTLPYASHLASGTSVAHRDTLTDVQDGRPDVIVVHTMEKPTGSCEGSATAMVHRQVLEPSVLQIPPNAFWVDLIEPTIEEDRMVQEFVGVPVPTKVDPDYTEPAEAHYSEDGIRYLHALFISEPEETPDVTGVTFVIAPTTLVTVRYDPVETFDLFSQKLCRAPAQAPLPDAVALGLINTGLNRTARALSKTGESLDRIASAIYGAKGDQSKRNQVYSDTLDALGREDEKISNLRESMVSVERLLLFLMSEGLPENMTKSMRQATKNALRDLQTMEQDASFKAQKVQFLLDSTLGRINLAQNDIIKLFSVIAVIFMPPTVIASIYGMNFKVMPELDWRWGYPLAIMLMAFAAIAPYLFFRWKKWL